MDLVATASAVSLAALGSLVAAFGQVYLGRRRLWSKAKPPSLEQRLSDLADLMSASGQALEEVQAEIQTRVTLADKAKQDAEEAEKLAQLSEPQRQALARLVRAEIAGEVTKSSRKALWQQALVNFAFFVAGAIVSLLITIWFGS